MKILYAVNSCIHYYVSNMSTMFSYLATFVKTNEENTISYDTREDDDDSLLIEEEDDPVVVKKTDSSLYELMDEYYFVTIDFTNHDIMNDPEKKKDCETKIKKIIMEIAMLDYHLKCNFDIKYFAIFKKFMNETVENYLEITRSSGSLYNAFSAVRSIVVTKVEEVILKKKNLICWDRILNKDYLISKEDYDKIFKTIDESDVILNKKVLREDPSIKKSKFKLSASNYLKRTVAEIKITEKFEMFKNLYSNFERGMGIPEKNLTEKLFSDFSENMMERLFDGKEIY